MSSSAATLSSQQIQNQEKSITCWLPKGASKPLVEKLFARGLTRLSVSLARGSFVHDPVARNGLQEQSEKEVVTILTSCEEADEVFQFIYREGGLDQMDGGFLFMGGVSLSSVMALPETTSQIK